MAKLMVVFLVSLFLGSVQASVLSDAATGLADKTWVKLPANTSLNGLDIPYALLYWADSGCWDPVRKRMTWVGYPGGCCGGGPGINYFMLTYTEASNIWTVSSVNFSSGGSGHSYDGNTLDPATGDHYFTLYNRRQVNKWDGQTWSLLPEIPSGATPSMAVAWFPEINKGKGGLVHVNGGGHIAWYDGSTWTALSGAQTGDYNLFAEYNPIHKAVWLGAGNGSERISYTLDSGLRFTRMADAPVSLNVGASLKSVDPVSGKHIVTALSSGEFWEFDLSQNRWSPLTGMKGDVPDLGGEKPWLQVPIANYGVILYFHHNYNQRDVYLYRHTAGTPVHIRPTPSTKSMPSAELNSVTAVTAFYDLHGRIVHRVKNPVHVRNFRLPGCLSGGVYLIRVSDGDKNHSNKLLYQR